MCTHVHSYLYHRTGLKLLFLIANSTVSLMINICHVHGHRNIKGNAEPTI